MRQYVRSRNQQRLWGTADRNLLITAMCESGVISREEIAKHFGLSRERVRQIYERWKMNNRLAQFQQEIERQATLAP